MEFIADNVDGKSCIVLYITALISNYGIDQRAQGEFEVTFFLSSAG